MLDAGSRIAFNWIRSADMGSVVDEGVLPMLALALAPAGPPRALVLMEPPPSPVAVSPTVAPIVVVSGGAAFRPEQEDDRAQEYLDTKLTCPCNGWRARRSPNRRAPSGSGARWLRRVSPCVALGGPNGRENACQK